MTSEPASTRRPNYGTPIRPNPTAEPNDHFSLPADLTEWVEPSVLRTWVEEEVDKLEWTQPEVLVYLRQHPDYHPRILFSLLVYAYATQVLGSDEIANRCYSDKAFQVISHGEAPSAPELMRFRRENRGLLRGLLYQVFVRAIRDRDPAGNILLPPGLKRTLLDSAVERLDVARHMDSLDE